MGNIKSFFCIICIFYTAILLYMGLIKIKEKLWWIFAKIIEKDFLRKNFTLGTFKNYFAFQWGNHSSEVLRLKTLIKGWLKMLFLMVLFDCGRYMFGVISGWYIVEWDIWFGVLYWGIQWRFQYPWHSRKDKANSR